MTTTPDRRDAVLVHIDFVRPLTRYARTVREPAPVLQELDEAVSRAIGHGGDPGPVWLDSSADILRAEVPRPTQLPEHFAPKATPVLVPERALMEAAVDFLCSAKRPLIISGRGARGAGKALCTLLDKEIQPP